MIERLIVIIRPYEDANLGGVITVFLQSIRGVATKDYSQAQVDAWAQTDRDRWRVRRPSRPTWVAVDNREIVGFSDLEPGGHLDIMYVHPAWQGRRIATLLFSAVEKAARAQQLPSIFTEASVTARPFFEKRGFELIAQQEVAIRGQVLRNFRMRKALR